MRTSNETYLNGNNSTNHMTLAHETGKMTSLQIAEITNKQHKDVLEAIRKMEPAWQKVNRRKFPLVNYTDAKGEQRPMYELSKTECLYIATKFNDEARAKLVLRWEQLEVERSKPLGDCTKEPRLRFSRQGILQNEIAVQKQRIAFLEQSVETWKYLFEHQKINSKHWEDIATMEIKVIKKLKSRLKKSLGNERNGGKS